MRNVIENLENWQKIVGAFLVTVTLINLVPDSWWPMTHGEHKEASRYTEENFAARNIHYFEKKLCNGIVLAPEQHEALQVAYMKYREATGKEYFLAGMEREAKCEVVNNG